MTTESGIFSQRTNRVPACELTTLPGSAGCEPGFSSLLGGSGCWGRIVARALPATQSNHSLGVLWRKCCEVGPNGVVVFRPKGPAVHIAWPSGPGKSPPNHRSGPTGRQFISSARCMAGPLGLKIFFCSRTWPSRPGYWNGWPFGPEMQLSGRLNSSQQNNALNVC